MLGRQCQESRDSLQRHMRKVQSAEDDAAPFVLQGCACIGQVATMDDEVDVRSAVDVSHLVSCIREPQVGVADESHAQRVSIGKAALNLCRLSDIHASLALEFYIVGMGLEHILTRQQQQCA